MMRQATYALRILKVGPMDVPDPQIFWMSEWDRWLSLQFNILLIQRDGITALVNTGPPADLGPLNAPRPINARQTCGIHARER